MDREAEVPALFGPQDRLVGLLNHRDGDAPVACLLLNVGVTQRIGPRRLNVRLARLLGGLSVTSLRFDLSGIGDSGPAQAHEDYRSQAVADLRCAMDWVERTTGIGRFMVLGICSGAINGFRAALEDPRIVGLMMFDGYAFPTRRTRWVHDWTRLKTTPPRVVAKKILNRIGALLGKPAPATQVSIFYASRDGSAPDRKEFARSLDALAARGVDFYIGYSGSLLSLHNHASQFQRCFAKSPFLERLTYAYLPEIDHIPTSQQAQARFLEDVSRWVLGCIERRAAVAHAGTAAAPARTARPVSSPTGRTLERLDGAAST